jgi:hypothetical protein
MQSSLLRLVPRTMDAASKPGGDQTATSLPVMGTCHSLVEGVGMTYSQARE